MSEYQDIHILLVEDSPTQAVLAENILTKAGFKVTTRGNGEEALNFLNNEKVSIILSDIVMPVMDGFTLCQKVKSKPDLNKIPFILLTNLTDLKSVIRSLNCGADNYLNKPIDEETLISTIKSMLSADLTYDDPVFSKNINFNKEEFTINSKASRILNLLLTLYSDIINKNNELTNVNDNLQYAREQLRKTNDELVKKLFELKVSEEKFRSLVSTIPDIVYKIDSDGFFTFVNDAVIKIGYLPEELIGKHFSYIIIPEQVDKSSRKKVIQRSKEDTCSSEVVPQLFDEQRTGDRKTVGLEITLVTKNDDYLKPPTTRQSDKDIVIAEVSASGLYEKAPEGLHKRFIGTVGVIHDISQHKVLEKQLEKAREEAELANKYKSQFLANMSHEIRTPMNAIIGLNNLLQRTELNSKQRNYITKVHDSASNLLGIINDILDFSKIEAGKLHIEYIEFNLHELLDSISNIVILKAEEKNLELIIDIGIDVPSKIIGDPLRIRQILHNLINNAVKFTEKGEIKIECSVIEDRAEEVKLFFSVTDTGCGLTEEQKLKLFNSFMQADATITRNYGGTGLGLSISKNLVELMNGEIGVDSTINRGSTFWFTCTFRYAENNNSALETIPRILNDLRILIVDDNKSARMVIKHYLERFSSIIDMAEDGKTALKMIKDKQYNVVFLDWKMPEMTGFHVARKIKSYDNIIQPHIIMVTCYGQEEIIQECNELDLDGFLLKPITQSLLFDSLIGIYGEDELVSKSIIEPENKFVLPDLKNVSILLVEDNEINQLVAKEIIEYQGAEVTIASNGVEAINKVKNKKFDLILMDIQMPILDGYKAAKRIREIKDYISIPIIAMSANVMTEDRDKAFASGMNDFISKPIILENLFPVLSKWIDMNRIPISDNEKDLDDRIISENQLPSFLPGLDIKQGLSRVKGNQQLYIKLLCLFLKSNQNIMIDFKKYLSGKDYEMIRKTTHKLKGAAGNLGADSLYKSANEIEIAIKNNQISRIENIFINFESELNILFNSISEVAEERNTVTETSIEIDLYTVAILLNNIIESLERDLGFANKKLKELSPYLADTEVYAEFKIAEKAVEEFDTDLGSEYLLKIANLLDIKLEGLT